MLVTASSPSLRRLTACALVIGAAVLAVAQSASPTVAADEWVPGKYMRQALARVMRGARTVTDKGKFGLDDGSSCFMGALLGVGKTVDTGMPLKGGEQYVFIGGGDDDVADMDLAVLNDTGKIVATDVEDDANPVVVFRPKSDGRYRVQMRLAKSADKNSFCCYATLREAGIDVPVVNLNGSSTRLMSFCETIANKRDGAAFLDGEGEWALVGTILHERESFTQSGIDLTRDTPHAFVAVADGQAIDIDMVLVDADGKAFVEDTEDDPNPMIFTSRSGSVGMKLINAKSKGPTLVLGAILKTKR